MILALLGAALATEPPSPPSAPPPPSAEPRTPPAFPDVVRALGLTGDQERKVRDLTWRADTELVDIRARVDKLELELRHQMDSEKPDPKLVMKAVDELSVAEGDLRRNRIRLMLAMREVLTPEQWAQLQQLRAEHEPGAQPRR